MASYIRSYVYLIFLSVATASAQVCAIPNGCTGASTAAGARTNLGAAGSPINSDLTVISALQDTTLSSLPNPGGPPTGVVGGGGSLGAGNRFAACAGVDAGGFLTGGVSTVSANTPTSGSNSITWTCPTVAGATSYKWWVGITSSLTRTYTSCTANPCVQLTYPAGTVVLALPLGSAGNIVNGTANTFTIDRSTTSDGTLNFNTGTSVSVAGVQVNSIAVMPLSDQSASPSSSPDVTLEDPAGTQGGGLEFLVNSSNGVAQILFSNATSATTAYLDNTMSLELIGTGSVGAETGNIGAAAIKATGNVTVHSGTNTVLRCTTGGTLPVGALTINAANCAASVDTGLRVN